jgi:hypothetical protein
MNRLFIIGGSRKEKDTKNNTVTTRFLTNADHIQEGAEWTKIKGLSNVKSGRCHAIVAMAHTVNDTNIFHKLIREEQIV